MILKSMTNFLLAGDIGGTKTLLGVFEPAPGRPRPVAVRSFGTLDYETLPQMIDAFLREDGLARGRIGAACFGVAGPVLDEAASLTNVPWRVDARNVSQTFQLQHVRLLNDLQAMAYSVPVLDDSEVFV